MLNKILIFYEKFFFGMQELNEISETSFTGFKTKFCAI